MILILSTPLTFMLSVCKGEWVPSAEDFRDGLHLCFKINMSGGMEESKDSAWQIAHA